jgi:hypothetical protein
MKTNVTVLMVERRPDKPFSIRKKSGGWLCANTANRNNWHYANTFSAGVTEYSTLEEAEDVCKLLRNHEIVELKF